VTGIAKALGEPTEEPSPFTGTSSVAKRPDADVGEIRAEPMGPGGGVVVAVAPGGEVVTAQAMDEDDVGLAVGVIASGDLMEVGQRLISPGESGY